MEGSNGNEILDKTIGTRSPKWFRKVDRSIRSVIHKTVYLGHTIDDTSHLKKNGCAALVHLLGQAKEEFNKIQLELAELSTKFSNNVLDATKGFSLTLTDEKDVDGLPATSLALAAQSAKVGDSAGVSLVFGFDRHLITVRMFHSRRRAFLTS